MVNAAIQEWFLTNAGIPCAALKYSYKVELLRLENGEEKIKLARACVYDAELNARGLKQRITSYKTGRISATRQLENYLARAGRLLKGEGAEILTDVESLGGLKASDYDRYIEEAGMLLRQLGALGPIIIGFIENLRKKKEEIGGEMDAS